MVGSADGPFRYIVAPKVNTIALNRGMIKSMPAIRKFLRRVQPDILFASQLHVKLVAIASAFLEFNPFPDEELDALSKLPKQSLQEQLTQFKSHLAF